MLSLERGVTNEPFSVRNDFTLNAQAYAEKRLSQVLGNTANFEISDSIEATPVNSASSVVTTTQTETASTAAIVKQSIDYFTAREAAFRAATSATAFHTAKQLLLSGKDAKTVENLTYIASSGTLSAEETFETDATTAAPLSPVSNSAAYDAGYGIMTLTAEPEWDPSKFIQSPATIELNEQENINMYTGGVRYTKNLVSIPGENGMDLVLDLKYDSDEGRHGMPGYTYVSSMNEIMSYISYELKYRDLYDIGMGWSFDLPYMWKDELYIPGKGKFQTHSAFTLEDMQSGVLQADELPAWLNATTSMSTVSLANGYTYYFKNEQFLGVQDRFGNYIRCTYHTTDGWGRGKIATIYASNTRSISFAYNETESGDRSVVITRPDDQVITLSMDAIDSYIDLETSQTISGEGCTCPSYTPCYQLSAVSLPDEGTITFVNTTYKTTSHSIDSGGELQPICYTVLSDIVYPNGAKSRYTYDSHLISKEFSIPIEYMSMSTHHIEDGNRTYNRKTFEYGKYIESTLRSDFTFDDDGILIQIEKYNNTNIGFVSPPVWELSSRTEYTRDDNHLITQTVTTEFDGEFSRVTTENFAYNEYGALEKYWSPFAEGDTSEDSLYKTEYTYYERLGTNTVSPLCIQTSKSYKIDADTTVTEQAILNDVFLPTTVQVLENDTVIAKTDYTYELNGNVATIKKYPDVTNPSNYILNEFEYFYGTLPYETTVKWFKDPEGLYASPYGELKTLYSYDILWNKTDEIYPDDTSSRYTYDKSGRVTSASRWSSNNALLENHTYTYDIEENTTTYTNAANSYVYHYNGLGLLRTLTENGGITLQTNEYDEYGRLFITSNVSNQNTSNSIFYAYDSKGRNRSKWVSDDYYGMVYNGSFATYTDIANTAGDSWVVTKNGGQSAYEWDNKLTPLNIETYTYYNKYGQKTYEGTTGGTETAYTYDHLGRVLTEVSPTVHNTYTYDALGRVISVKNKQNNTATNEYDDLGRLIRTTDFLGAETLYTYDALDRVIITQVEQSDNVYMTTKNYYDMSGNLFQVLTSAGTAESPTWNTTRYEYDELDRLTKQTVGDIVTEYTYDALGNILTQKTGGVGTTYTYDALGRMLTSTDALGKTEYYVYDNNGYLIQKTDRKGNVHNMTYNILGRLISESGPDYAKTYDYYATGAIAKITQGTNTQSYVYDNVGRLTSQTDPGGIVKTYSYNAAGLKDNFVLTVNGTVHMDLDYLYNGMGQLSGLKDAGETVVTYSYDACGRMTGESYINGFNTYISYNAAGQMTLLGRMYQYSTLPAYESTYGLDGNRLTETHSSTTKQYTYNYAGMLHNETVYENEVNTLYKNYLYDNRGNQDYTVMFEPYDGGASYTYDANNRLTSSSNSEYNESTGQSESINGTYTYDDNGNLAMVTKNGVGNGYSFNSQNQMTESLVNGSTTSYTYNPDGLRRSKQTMLDETIHVWDGTDICADINTGGYVAKYVRGHRLLYMKTGTTRFWYLYNIHGDVVGFMDDDGNIVMDCDYDAFGNMADGPGIYAGINPFLYCGEYYDHETELIYLRARYYDPSIGRFISEDPIQDGTNWYSYCANNPVMFVDPSGYIFKPISRHILSEAVENPIFVGITQKGYFSDVFHAFGFDRDEKGMYHAHTDAWQQIGGYNDVYDYLFDCGTYMEKEKFTFSSNNREYVLWAWKGDYWNLGAGAEMGIYSNESGIFGKADITSPFSGIWLVDTNLAMDMTLTLYDDKIELGRLLSSYTPEEKQWWIATFDPYYQDPNPLDLTPVYTVTFNSATMYNDFKNSFVETDLRWSFDDNQYMATFIFAGEGS